MHLLEVMLVAIQVLVLTTLGACPVAHLTDKTQVIRITKVQHQVLAKTLVKVIVLDNLKVGVPAMDCQLVNH